MRPLKPYQVPVLEWALSRERIALLLEKRLGKSTISIRWALSKKPRTVLIVAPLSACPDWLSDLEADGLKGRLLYGTREDRDRLLLEGIKEAFHNLDLDGSLNPPSISHLPQKTDLPAIFLTNPQGLFIAGRGANPQATELALFPWDCVILDEAFVIKSPRSQLNLIFKECLQPKYRAILTGEIAPERPQDIFEQVRWCFDAFMGQRNFWKWEHENFTPVGYDMIPKPGTLKKIREALHARSYVLSRNEAGIGSQITRERRYCYLPPKIRKVYAQVEEDFEADGFEFKHAAVKYTWLRRLSGGYPVDPDTGERATNLLSSHKMEVLFKELILGTYSRDKLVVLFGFNEEIKVAEEWAKKYDVGHAVIHGAVNPKERGERIHAFNTGTRVRVVFAQAAAFTYGINASGADTMIRYSMPPIHNIWSQSADRIIHPDKQRPLHYIDLITKDSIDEDILIVTMDKRSTSQLFSRKLRENFYRRRHGGILPGAHAHKVDSMRRPAPSRYGTAAVGGIKSSPKAVGNGIGKGVSAGTTSYSERPPEPDPSDFP